MKLPPLVERELRAGARWPGFFWLRGLLAVAAGFQGYELLDRYALAPGNLPAGFAGGPLMVVSGLTLLRQMLALLFFLAKNAALIAWARHGLRRDLHLEDNSDSKVKIAVIAQVPLPDC
jgi:hypothetical protein